MALQVQLKAPNGRDITLPTGLFINNEFVASSSGTKITSVSPADGSEICSVEAASAQDVDTAVKAARAAFEHPSWADCAGRERSVLMHKLADLVEQHAPTLATLETWDNGKPYSVSLNEDLQEVLYTLRYYAGWADKIHGQTIDVNPETLTYTRHEPIGVCGQIIPWNFPMLMWSWKIGPAVATGNTVVLKTAEQTPLSALYAAKLIKEAGFPPGVINIISGFGRTAGAAIASHMDVDKVAFTGSTLVGRNILQAAAKSNLKKVTLELGGKSPNIVFEDADIENALKWASFGIYFNHGQCCCAGSRILVQESIYEEFLARFKERSEQNKVGDPFDPQTFQGPQVSQLQFDRIMGYIQDGKQAGARVVTGGERLGDKGYFIKPTIFADVNGDMKIVQEEIFGPVCTVQKFKTEEEAIKLANSTNYGLASAVHTKNVNTAIRVSNAIKAGSVWVNNYNMIYPQAPFGGYKESGLGRELGSYALENYTQVKTVHIRTGDCPFP